MMRLKFSNIGKSFGLVAISLVVMAPIMLMAFITMPSQHKQANYEKNGVMDVNALINQVLKLNQAKKHQEAIDLLLWAVNKNSGDDLLKALLTQSFESFLEDEERLGIQEIKANPTNLRAYIRVSNASELRGDSFRAMDTLLSALLVNDQSPELWMKIAKLEEKSGHSLDAFDVFKEVIRLDPKSGDAYNNAAFSLSRGQNKQDLSVAQTYAAKACKIDPSNADYIDTLAEVKFKMGNNNEAVELIKKAIFLKPEIELYKNQLKKFSSKLDASYR